MVIMFSVNNAIVSCRIHNSRNIFGTALACGNLQCEPNVTSTHAVHTAAQASQFSLDYSGKSCLIPGSWEFTKYPGKRSLNVSRESDEKPLYSSLMCLFICIIGQAQ